MGWSKEKKGGVSQKKSKDGKQESATNNHQQEVLVKEVVDEKSLRLTDFFYEVGILNKTPRSGFHFLLDGKQNVAEHSYRTAIISLFLAFQQPDIDLIKVLIMALFHDLAETRISDLNYVQQSYVTAETDRAEKNQLRDLPQSDIFSLILEEYHKKESPEAKLVKDADNLELLLTLNEINYKNPIIEQWQADILQRFLNNETKQLAVASLKIDPWHWWSELNIVK